MGGDGRAPAGALGEVGMDREDSIPTGRWAAPGAAKAGSGSR